MKRRVWRNARLSTMATAGDFGVIEHGALAVVDQRIAWVGAASDLPGEWQNAESIDAGGAWITPGLIDCHTHLVYAGNRAEEHAARFAGASYAALAARGGGILATVRATRAASEDELLDQSIARLRALSAQGVTTVEIKSGYGLDIATELKMLRVARRLGEETALRVCPTFLGAHALPPEYAGRADDYVARLIDELLPQVASERIALAVDAYHEHLAFDGAQVERLFEGARAHGLPVKLHADQLSDNGGAALAARCGALSADHLEYASTAGIAALAAAGTVAVLLPGAYHFLRQTTPPPVNALRRARVPIAVATDCNPGTSPLTSLPLAMNLAVVLFGLTPLEAWQGATRNAARALGLEGEIGSLEVGKRADLALWNFTSPLDLVYTMGQAPCLGTAIAGEPRETA